MQLTVIFIQGPFRTMHLLLSCKCIKENDKIYTKKKILRMDTLLKNNTQTGETKPNNMCSACNREKINLPVHKIHTLLRNM